MICFCNWKKNCLKNTGQLDPTRLATPLTHLKMIYFDPQTLLTQPTRFATFIQPICNRHGLGLLDALRRRREKKGTDALRVLCSTSTTFTIWIVLSYFDYHPLCRNRNQTKGHILKILKSLVRWCCSFHTRLDDVGMNYAYFLA